MTESDETCRQCNHPVGWHNRQLNKLGCLECSCELSASEAARATMGDNEEAILQVIDERDRNEDRITEIARALGVTEEWSSQNDLGLLALERIAESQANAGFWVRSATRLTTKNANLRKQLAEARARIDAAIRCMPPFDYEEFRNCFEKTAEKDIVQEAYELGFERGAMKALGEGDPNG